MQNSSPKSLVQIPQNEISIYTGSLTAKCVVQNTAQIRKAFPALPIEFFDVFTDRIKANGFCDDRLNDSVNYVIDTCIYPTPTIAQFVSFDRRFKVHNYEEMCRLSSSGDINWHNYRSIKFPDRKNRVWVHVDDIIKFNLKTSDDDCSKES